MAFGNECIELTEAGSWEQFPEFADRFVQQIGAEVVRKNETVDMHIWKIKYKGAKLNLVYDDFPNGISIEPRGILKLKAIDELFNLISEQSNENGI